MRERIPGGRLLDGSVFVRVSITNVDRRDGRLSRATRRRGGCSGDGSRRGAEGRGSGWAHGGRHRGLVACHRRAPIVVIKAAFLCGDSPKKQTECAVIFIARLALALFTCFPHLSSLPHAFSPFLPHVVAYRCGCLV